MIGTRLQSAIANIQRFVEMPSAIDVSAALLTPRSLEAPVSNRSINDIILNLVLDVSRGSKPIRNIETILSDFLIKEDPTEQEKELAKKILMYFDGNKLQKENQLTPIIGESNKKLGVMQVDTVRVMPTSRNVDAVAVFLNVIPTIEFSRCVPYLTIDVQTGRPPISDDARAQGLTFIKFLQGAAAVTDANKNLLEGLTGTEVSGKDRISVTRSGMELFTAPQTLVNPDRSLDGGRAIGVIDRFRPLMSIDKLDIEVKAQIGFFSYRTANLELTLHDRSRLSEIADFVRPDLYGHTELMLEYGWSHPDNSENNVYAVLLNSMRMREKYGIVNSSFNFTKTGEVKVKLRLFTKGFTDVQVVSIAESDEIRSAVESVQKLQTAIATIKSRLSQTNDDKSTKEIRPEQKLFSAAEDLGATLTLSKEGSAALNKFLDRTTKATGDAKILRDSLSELYIGSKGKGKGKKSAKDVLTQKVTAVIDKKLKALSQQPTTKSDPFMVSSHTKLSSVFKGVNLPRLSFNLTKDYISFGKLMSIFVGSPLSKKETYEEVQLIFYPFNSKAAAAARINIAEFPIKISELKQGFTELGKERGLDMPIRDFISYIANNFIDDMASSAYGLSDKYRAVTGPGGVRTTKSQNPKVDESDLFDAVTARIQQLNVQDNIFKMPQVDVMLETLPVDASVDGKSVKIEADKTILKIHFFDRVASAYESLGQLILASRREDIRTLGDSSKLDPSDHRAVFNEFVNLAKTEGLITAVPSKDPNLTELKAYNVTYDNEKLRGFLRRNMPSIVYGTNNTGIKDASFATIQEPMLSTIHMRRAGEQGPLAPQGLTKANLPLRTLPAKVSMTTMGCPLVFYMQQFFIDFGTGTTIDNIYGVNSLSHTLGRGVFETKMDLVPLDAYGRYESLATQVGVVVKKLSEIIEDEERRAASAR